MGADIIVLPDGCSRSEAVAFLSRDIPSNQYGLPQYFIRSDLLNLGEALSQDDIDAASVGLGYHEGYPTTSEGIAFWNQLPHEPAEAFQLFRRYIDQAELHGFRQMDVLATEVGETLSRLRDLYAEFYWSARARAYDLFITAADLRKRQLRIRSMETKHYDIAMARIDELMTKFASLDEDDNWVNELNAKEAVEALDTLVKLARLSVGLTGQNASSLPKNPLPDGASPQAIMEHITRGASMDQGTAENFQVRLRALFDDPNSGMQLQDAIIRFTRPDTPKEMSGAAMGEDGI